MKASLRWIQEFVDLPTTDPQVIATALDNLGLEVEGTETVAAAFTGVIVARVTGIRSHPSADRVRLVTIDDGAGGLEVVCGAWNFDVGATVAYATVGSRLAGGLEVGERDIRGVRSPGMIASERETGIGDEGGGILLLEDEPAPWNRLLPSRCSARCRIRCLGDAQPAGCHVDPGSGPRAWGPLRRAGASDRHVGSLGGGDHRRPGSDRGWARVPALYRPRDRRGDDRSLTAVDAHALTCRRGASHQQRRRRHQLRDARDRATVARVRSRPNS